MQGLLKSDKSMVHFKSKTWHVLNCSDVCSLTMWRARFQDSMATMVTLPRHNVAFYVDCLACSYCERLAEHENIFWLSCF